MPEQEKRAHLQLYTCQQILARKLQMMRYAVFNTHIRARTHARARAHTHTHSLSLMHTHVHPHSFTLTPNHILGHYPHWYLLCNTYYPALWRDTTTTETYIIPGSVLHVSPILVIAIYLSHDTSIQITQSIFQR